MKLLYLQSLKSDKGEVKGYYKRVVPWLYLGTFEDVPEKAENWEEFMKTGGGLILNYFTLRTPHALFP